jgi:hypothetical protein
MNAGIQGLVILTQTFHDNDFSLAHHDYASGNHCDGKDRNGESDDNSYRDHKLLLLRKFISQKPEPVVLTSKKTAPLQTGWMN